MEESISGLKPKRVRKAKAELDSRVFRDGAIYLFRRADYKKPTWFCRVKVPYEFQWTPERPFKCI